MQKIISWNVASVRARLPLLLEMLSEQNPDVVFLQEVKAEEVDFPFMDIDLAGYKSRVSGQKGLNGVAILTRKEVKLISTSLSGFEDQARYVEVEMPNGVHMISVYVPNGCAPMNNPTDTSKLEYKLRWFDALFARLKELKDAKIPFVIGGDFNVIFKDEDVYNPASFRESALMVPEVRKKLQNLLDLGLVDSIRHFYPSEVIYSFWDFQGGAWFKNNGILLDMILLSSDFPYPLQSAGVLKEYRGRTKPSDHTPIYCQIDA